MTPLKTFQNLSAEKQERIIRVATREFGEKGYEGASINAMVQALGIAKGSMFQYFGDKQGLFLFTFAQSMEMVKENLRAVRERTRERDLFHRLEETLRAGATFIRDNPEAYRLYLRILSESRFPYRDDILRSLREYGQGFIRGLLETAEGRRELAPGIDIGRAGFMIDAVMDRFLQARMIPHMDAGLGIYDADEEEVSHWIGSMVGMIRGGIGREGGEAGQADAAPSGMPPRETPAPPEGGER